MFIPKKSSTEVENYKKIFLRGAAFRVDSGYDFMDVIERDQISDWHATYGVGYGNFPRVDKYYDQLMQAIDELKKEGYVVKKVTCNNSPACQYHAVMYYLA